MTPLHAHSHSGNDIRATLDSNTTTLPLNEAPLLPLHSSAVTTTNDLAPFPSLTVLLDSSTEASYRASLADHGCVDCKSTYRLLIVDDSASNRKLLARVIASPDVVIDLACDGAEALDMCRRRHYSAVLTDVNMPQLNGLELTRALRRKLVPNPLQLGASGEGETGEGGASSSASTAASSGAASAAATVAAAVAAVAASAASLAHDSDDDTTPSSVVIVGVTACALPTTRSDCIAAGMDALLVKPLSIAKVRMCNRVIISYFRNKFRTTSDRAKMVDELRLLCLS
jgi:CheY-like chemotaxis protein